MPHDEVVADQLASPHVAGPDHRAAIGATCRRRSESVTRALPYLYLALAIAFEVVGTSALKASQTFTRLVPSLVTLIAYTASFVFLALSLTSRSRRRNKQAPVPNGASATGAKTPWSHSLSTECGPTTFLRS